MRNSNTSRPGVIAGWAVLVLLGGCAALPASEPTAGTQMDRHLEDSANRIDRMLGSIAKAGGISAAVPHAGSVIVNGQFITVRWQGNAADVLRKIADAKGLHFSAMGRPMPLPISIDATNTDFVAVLENIGTQLGGRADVVLKANALEIRYRAS